MTNGTLQTITAKKRVGDELSNAEIITFIDLLTKKLIPEKQAIEILHELYNAGLSFNETKYLTSAYVNSGLTLDLSSLGPFVIDKHSTGGVGDKISLILVPWLASVGAKILKLSGRSLGFTGGTIDKLESIPGFNVNKPIPDLIEQVHKVGCGITGAGPDLCPADKITYALRDANNLVDETGLIAASVLCKKIAGGAKKVVIDLKVGDGAFMKTITEAQKLATLLCKLGKEFKIKLSCVLTSMDNPLGLMIGNANEVAEAFEFIENRASTLDLIEVTMQLGIEALLMANMADHEDMAKDFMLVNLDDGNAKITLHNWISEQSDASLPVNVLEPVLIFSYFPVKSGYLKQINARAIGEFVRDLGAGRHSINDRINPIVGVQLHKQCGAKLDQDVPLLTVFHANTSNTSLWKQKIDEMIVISNQKPELKSSVIETIRNW